MDCFFISFDYKLLHILIQSTFFLGMYRTLQALSSAYLPIGAVLVSPEVSDVKHSQSSNLGMLDNTPE